MAREESVSRTLAFVAMKVAGTLAPIEANLQSGDTLRETLSHVGA
jgi:hypothetical protein